MTEDYEQTEESKYSYEPLIIAGGIALLFIGLVVFIPLAIGGAAILAIGVFKLFQDSVEGKFADLKDSIQERWPLDFLSKQKLGVWIFLMSEILIFGSLIIAYIFVRFSSSSWPIASQIHNVNLRNDKHYHPAYQQLSNDICLSLCQNRRHERIKNRIIWHFGSWSIFSCNQAWI